MLSLAERARELDATDPLASCRKLFDLDDSVVYLDGNSLGAPPLSVAERMEDVVRNQWGRRLIRSWGEGWWTAPERVGDRIAPLVGAAPGQVVVGDSTSANLFKALVAALRMSKGRNEIVVDAATFPTDGYIASSVARLTGATVRAAPLDALELNANTAVVLANQVDYRTGRAYDVAAVTASVHAAGALVLWDLCHSVGALPVDLDANGVDFAVGCTYKFLNGGPGAPAFLYVPTRLQASFDQPLAGWNGHKAPFAMAPDFEPSSEIARGRCGTPDILSLLALDAALDVWDGVTISDVRAKNLALTGFFIECVDSLVGSRVSVVTPRDSSRGSQVSLACSDAASVMDALIARDVIGDFRPPNVLRFGFAALYNRYTDALRAATTLAELA
ncbi:kynureninase [Allokutzneria sp. NRRL B-24872]|uniref:kynureninase n=1 Tax=Allokutzneria sp. NRRL B-24872 TaxID=1137961 RepID=UPI000A3C9AA3|nr:kynureninase [Allokutzneria sp. NRRL B-24872]